MEELAEIIDDMHQGFCEAILCGDGHGAQFVVKTRSAGRLALIKEWIAGRIGQRLGLPIPAFHQCYISATRAKFMVHREAEVLAVCPGFASKVVKDYVQLSLTTAPSIPELLRAQILLFDWWTINADRTDENPNLLWVAHDHTLHVIDHNLCFDSSLTFDEFWRWHIFRSDRPAMVSLRGATEAIMADILSDLPKFWQELPEEWLDTADFGISDVTNVLQRYTDREFWNPE